SGARDRLFNPDLLRSPSLAREAAIVGISTGRYVPRTGHCRVEHRGPQRADSGRSWHPDRPAGLEPELAFVAAQTRLRHGLSPAVYGLNCKVVSSFRAVPKLPSW